MWHSINDQNVDSRRWESDLCSKTQVICPAARWNSPAIPAMENLGLSQNKQAKKMWLQNFLLRQDLSYVSLPWSHSNFMTCFVHSMWKISFGHPFKNCLLLGMLYRINYGNKFGLFCYSMRGQWKQNKGFSCDNLINCWTWGERHLVLLE